MRGGRRGWPLPVALVVLTSCADGCGGDPEPASATSEDAADAGVEARDADGAEIAGDVLILAARPADLSALPTAVGDRLEALRPVARMAGDLHWALDGPGRPAVRDLLRGILDRPGDAPRGIIDRVRDFARPVMLWQGLEDPRSGRRFVPRFIPGELAAAAQAAVMAGADLPRPRTPLDPAATRIDLIEALLAEVLPLLFDGPEPPRDGGAAEEPAAGEAERLLERIEIALAMIPGQALGGLGTERPAQMIHDGGGPDLALIVGFRDFGQRAGFGALLAVTEERSEVAEIAAMAPRLQRMVGATADRVPAGGYAARELAPAAVVEATGAFGPVPRPGLFPVLDGPLFREPATGRLLLAVNLAGALDESPMLEALVRASSPDEETARRRLAHRSCARLARHALAAAAGSGTDGTEGRAPGFLVNRLGSAAPVMEHLRESLVALHLATDPGVAEALPGGEECARTVLDDFAASAVEHLLDTRDGREAPAGVARRVALGWLLERGALVPAEREDGAVLAVAEGEMPRAAVAELLGEVRRIRYAGDGEAARALIARHGSPPPSWVAAAEGVTAALGGITAVAFVLPPRMPERGSRGSAIPWP